MRPVSLVAASLFCPAGIGANGLGPAAPGPVPGFAPHAHGVPRKHLKTMTRAVQLGCAAVYAALEDWPTWRMVPAERRGLYVGASPQQGDAEDIEPALQAAGTPFTLGGFAERGVPMIPPLWLVKGLSNNILGYSSAQFDFQGDNGNWCDGGHGGSVALTNAVHAVAEGRVDLAVAGGADALVGAEALFGAPCAEGAAFLVLVAGEVGKTRVTAGLPTVEGAERDLGELGAAGVPIAIARQWLAGLLEVRAGGIHLFRD
ncbi:MAG: beta-ketoacyl synthase N-terminal-like domain-containing protein [Pseudomonadota bacterium]|nr:beta-ketoacyl synthase N-terminal-like domain-containing protein [Pseudomonadota bacterium]